MDTTSTTPTAARIRGERPADRSGTTGAEVSRESVARPGPYDEHPGFYLEDNRQNRTYNPINLEVLDAKYSTLLPEWLVEGKSVLDLGACLGAAGQWALFYGADRYTGVECQHAYASKGKALLGHWGTRAKLEQGDIQAYLANCPAESFDIVLAAGILYLFMDPKEIVGEMCRVAKHAVIVETNHPRLMRNGFVANPDACLTEYSFDQAVNLDDVDGSLTGIAAVPSVSALDLFFRLNGFNKREPKLEFPSVAGAAIYMDGSGGNAKLPLRYAVRYFRAADGKRLRSLQENLPERRGMVADWKTTDAYTELSKKYQRTREGVGEAPESWKFDAAVAERFETIARTEIPDYDRVIDQTIKVVAKSGMRTPKIIDVGSARGYTLKRLYESGYQNLYGVDNSSEMLTRSFSNAKLICSDAFPVSDGPFDVVIANWVLHFIENRGEYLSSIVQGMSANAMLVLTDKMQMSPLTHSLYHDMKRHNGVSEADIENKQRQLTGVLTPYPVDWYFESLRRLGFARVDIINANNGFVTLLAQRR